MSDDVLCELPVPENKNYASGNSNGISTTEMVLNHLLFHKSLIDEKDSGARINKYVEMVQNLERGLHITIQDPFEKSIAIIFELVMNNRLDPWQIDLINFSRLYLDRIKDESEIDFVTAGRLIFMAWSILKLQSEAVLLIAHPPAEEIFYDAPAEDYFSISDANEPFSIEDVPLREMVRHQETRHVSLMELVNAFHEARKEAESRLNRIKQNQKPLEIDFGSKVHSENWIEDICLIWNRLRKFKSTVALRQLYKCGNIEDFITAFISVLYLAFYRINWVRLQQDDMPHGEIYVQRRARQKMPDNELEVILRFAKPSSQTRNL